MQRLLLMVFLMLFASGFVNAQAGAGDSVANRIAQKMKDSLQLSDSQKVQLYQLNLQLHNQKVQVRQQHSIPDSVRIHIQRVENTRDSLYHTILSEEKYLLYLQRKRNLISNN